LREIFDDDDLGVVNVDAARRLTKEDPLPNRAGLIGDDDIAAPGRFDAKDSLILIFGTIIGAEDNSGVCATGAVFIVSMNAVVVDEFNDDIDLDSSTLSIRKT
jgi:hypothetical protein